MPFVSHHFQEKKRNNEVPPWGIEPPSVKGGPLTTNAYTFQGLKGLPAEPIRNHTTNCFDPQSWRDRSSYKEQFLTPPNYSRHNLVKASVNRNHRPHPNSIIWPLEPNKGYMIWKPKVDLNEPKPYTAPNLLRNFYVNKWKTTNQTTYQNFHGTSKPIQAIHERAPSSNKDCVDVQTKPNSREVTRNETRNTNDRYRTPHLLDTIYGKTYAGDTGRPSTNARPIDYSWRNIKY